MLTKGQLTKERTKGAVGPIIIYTRVREAKTVPGLGNTTTAIQAVLSTIITMPRVSLYPGPYMKDINVLYFT